MFKVIDDLFNKYDPEFINSPDYKDFLKFK